MGYKTYKYEDQKELKFEAKNKEAFSKKAEVTKYKADQVKKKMPRIIVYEVTECEDPDSFRTEFLRSNDNVKDMVDYFELLKAVTVLRKDRNFANVVLEVSPQLHQSILLNSHVKLDFLMKHCEDYLFLIKCSKFCHYGHIATQCRGELPELCKKFNLVDVEIKFTERNYQTVESFRKLMEGFKCIDDANTE
ncbi:hypothetical protein QYM36_001633, partial [Artemia franciscana]